jgi:hypothetical protein
MIEGGGPGGDKKSRFRVVDGEGQRSGIDAVRRAPLKDAADVSHTIQAEPGADTSLIAGHEERIAESTRMGEESIASGHFVTLEDTLTDELGDRRMKKKGPIFNRE